MVDAADYEWASAYRWSLSSKGYAVRGVRVDGKKQLIRLHRALLGLEPGDKREGDHRNRDRLDNRRSNLRVTNRAENAQNLGSKPGSSSRFRGVSWDKRQQRWMAKVKLNGRAYFLGRFDSEERAADSAARFRETYMPFSEEGC